MKYRNIHVIEETKLICAKSIPKLCIDTYKFDQRKYDTSFYLLYLSFYPYSQALIVGRGVHLRGCTVSLISSRNTTHKLYFNV